ASRYPPSFPTRRSSDLSIAIAGPREIGVAVRLADDVVIPASALREVRGLIGAVRAGCEAAGRDPASLGIAVDVQVSIGRTSAERSEEHTSELQSRSDLV